MTKHDIKIRTQHHAQHYEDNASKAQLLQLTYKTIRQHYQILAHQKLALLETKHPK